LFKVKTVITNGSVLFTRIFKGAISASVYRNQVVRPIERTVSVYITIRLYAPIARCGRDRVLYTVEFVLLSRIIEYSRSVAKVGNGTQRTVCVIE
jgi:hypothetical protein